MLSLQNKDKKDSKDFYFACSQSPYNWKLTKDPYSDIRRKKFPILKDTYHSMRGYNNVIEPLFHIECKEELRSFNEKLNEKKINFKALAVNVDIKAFKNMMEWILSKIKKENIKNQDLLVK
ncbi:hypothetical protein H8356DRAFT_1069804 [Neocallimastix lanati (nom. inval.)]|nr:hypothetical protein H8356DRAFT_1069804 [Neocallimastix sp. JGI-2020a]